MQEREGEERGAILSNNYIHCAMSVIIPYQAIIIIPHCELYHVSVSLYNKNNNYVHM